MITTIVFDLDDTLYDEIEYCKSGLACVAQYLGKSPANPPAEKIYEHFRQEFTTGNRKKIFNSALQKLGIAYDGEFIKNLVTRYRSHSPNIALPSESKKVLDTLKKKYSLALLTDGFLPAQKLKVRALGIEGYFKCIIYTEQMGRECWKPSPAGFKEIMNRLNAKAKNIVYIADDETKDFIAPNQLGFMTVQIIRASCLHTDKGQSPDAPAKHIIRKISLLPSLIHQF